MPKLMQRSTHQGCVKKKSRRWRQWCHSMPISHHSLATMLHHIGIVSNADNVNRHCRQPVVPTANCDNEERCNFQFANETRCLYGSPKMKPVDAADAAGDNGDGVANSAIGDHAANGSIVANNASKSQLMSGLMSTKIFAIYCRQWRH